MIMPKLEELIICNDMTDLAENYIDEAKGFSHRNYPDLRVLTLCNYRSYIAKNELQ
jgi:hypothetical protein